MKTLPISLPNSLNKIYLLFLAVMCSCIAAEKPFYLEKDMVILPEIQGEWESYNPKKDSIEGHGIIRLMPDKKYLFLNKEKKPGTDSPLDSIEAVIFSLKNNIFIDFAYENADPKNRFYHIIHYLKINGKEMELYALNDEYLEELIDKHQLKLKYKPHSKGGDLIFTDETSILRQFLIKNINDPKLFKKQSVLRKIN